MIVIALVSTACDSWCRREDPSDSPRTECWRPAERGSRPPGRCVEGDEREPNDRPSQSTRVDGASCDDRVLTGSAGEEPDFFRVTGTKCGPLAARLEARVDAGFELCIFASCKYGKTGIADCEGYDGGGGTHVPGGMVGCCDLGRGQVRVDARCDSEFQSVRTEAPSLDAFIAVRANDAERTGDAGCVPYRVVYHF